MSRRGHVYRQFDALRASLAAALPDVDAVLDGEVACLDAQGRLDFLRADVSAEPSGLTISVPADVTHLNGAQARSGRLFPTVGKSYRFPVANQS